MIATEAVSAGTNTSAGPRPGSAPREMISSDFETFLRMLTAQIQNQDPLNPMDSSDYAVQLATFSGVEQQVRTNDLLQTVLSRLSGSDMSELSRWIGLEAQFGNVTQFSGAPVSLALLPDARADQAVLVVRDALGVEVQRMPVPHASRTVSWSGMGATGDTLPAGSYSFELENFAAGTRLSVTPAERFGKVVEARIDGGQTVLVLQDGGLILADDVTALRLVE